MSVLNRQEWSTTREKDFLFLSIFPLFWKWNLYLLIEEAHHTSRSKVTAAISLCLICLPTCIISKLKFLKLSSHLPPFWRSAGKYEIMSLGFHVTRSGASACRSPGTLRTAVCSRCHRTFWWEQPVSLCRKYEGPSSCFLPVKTGVYCSPEADFFAAFRNRHPILGFPWAE